ncbi:Ionotropic receptor 604, partial [Blattella germanica]
MELSNITVLMCKRKEMLHHKLFLSVLIVSTSLERRSVREEDIASCVNAVFLSSLPVGRPLHVSMATYEESTFKHSLTFCENVGLNLIDLMIGTTHGYLNWPLRITNVGKTIEMDITIDELVYLTGGYLLLLFPNEDGEVYELEDQLNELQYSRSWNPRAKFVIVVPDAGNTPPKDIAMKVCDVLWTFMKIINVLIVIPETEDFNSEHSNCGAEINRQRVPIYSWFPYDENNCGDIVDNVRLIDEWICDNCSFHEKSNLFPSKMPNNFKGCPIKVSSIGKPPYVFLRDEHHFEHESSYDTVGGWCLDFVYLMGTVLNFTLIFHEPLLELNKDSYVSIFTSLANDKADIAVGIIPNLVGVVERFDATIPYDIDNVEFLVPCPSKIPKAERVLGIFTFSVWAFLMLSYSAVGITLWGLTIGRDESFNFRTISNSLYSCWALLLGLSVPIMPKTAIVRSMFLLFVLFCLVVCYIFQAFFTTFLVEPGFEKKIETLEEIIKLRIPYGSVKFISKFSSIDKGIANYDKIVLSDVDCGFHYESCIRRVINKDNFFTIVLKRQAQYFASELGYKNLNRDVCFLDQKVTSGGIIFIFRKGSPLVPLVSSLMRKSAEYGILDKYWSMLKFEALLNSNVTKEEEDSYFVFSMDHLSPIFIFLAAGCIISSIIFILEHLLNLIVIVSERKRLFRSNKNDCTKIRRRRQLPSNLRNQQRWSKIGRPTIEQFQYIVTIPWE